MVFFFSSFNASNFSPAWPLESCLEVSLQRRWSEDGRRGRSAEGTVSVFGFRLGFGFRSEKGRRWKKDEEGIVM